MRLVGGAACALVGTTGLLYFKLALVDPAFTARADGTYGEMYGPISFFRIPVYVLCLALIVVGALIALRRPRERAGAL